MKSKCNLEKDAIICGGDFNINYFNKKEYGYLMSVLEHLKDPLEKSDEFTIQVPYDKEGKESNSLCTVCKKCLTLDTCQLEKLRVDEIFYNPNN